MALRTAIQHPHRVDKLVLVSTPFNRQGWFEEVLASQAQVSAAAAEAMKQLPLYGLYASIAPHPEDWPVLLTKMGELLGQDYDYSEAISRMQTPTLLVFGDADAISPAHAIAFFKQLGGGQRDGGWDGSGMSSARLSILPGLTHYTIFNSPALAATVTPFLDTSLSTKS